MNSKGKKIECFNEPLTAEETLKLVEVALATEVDNLARIVHNAKPLNKEPTIFEAFDYGQQKLAEDVIAKLKNLLVRIDG